MFYWRTEYMPWEKSDRWTLVEHHDETYLLMKSLILGKQDLCDTKNHVPTFKLTISATPLTVMLWKKKCS